MNQDNRLYVGNIRGVILVLLTVSNLCFGAEQFELIKAIESSHFARLCGVAASGEKEFVVIDDKKNVLMRLDWNGSLLGTSGQRGQGPGEFMLPMGISRYLDKLVVLDVGNSRLFETDIALKEQHLFKLCMGAISGLGLAINENLFLCEHSFESTPGAPSLYLMNRQGEIVRSFFTHLPENFKASKNPDSATYAAKIMASPVAGVDHEYGRLLITFVVPDNPIVLYLYSSVGDYLNEFRYRFHDSYRFPVDRPKTLKALKGVERFSVKGIFGHQGHWFVFLTRLVTQAVKQELTIHNLSQYTRSDTSCLIFNAEGEFVTRYLFDFNFTPCDLTTEGILLGISKEGGHRNPSSMEDAVMIYKVPCITH